MMLDTLLLGNQRDKKLLNHCSLHMSYVIGYALFYFISSYCQGDTLFHIFIII